MSNTVTRRMLAVYRQMAPSLMFLSGFFQSPPGNFHTSEEVEIDIVRNDEDISVVIQDLSTSYRMNSEDLYTNKAFKPPIHKEAIALNAHDLMKRMPGQNPFQSPDFRANVIERMMTGMVKVERKIRRSVELQASQVLQTGKVVLVDSGGDTLYAIDYKPKTAHFPTAGTSWATATGAQMLDNISALAEVIRNNGQGNPDQLFFGITAFEKFISNSTIQSRFDTRRMDFGSLGLGQPRGEGGTFQGRVQIGNYLYDVFTYGGRYKHPSSGTITQFLDDGKVIVRASVGRLDATFGAIPNIGQLIDAGGSARLLPELPSRLSDSAGSMDLFTNVWMSPDGEQMFGGVGARPLMIPTAIDTFGCLDTQL